jgi:hypothetical protein
MMPTDWLFWLSVGLGLFGSLYILYAARAKRNPRGRLFDSQSRQLLILLGISAVIGSLSMALTYSGWRFPLDYVVEGILLLISIIILVTVAYGVNERRNYARAIAAQNAQSSQETNEEVG